ncbi:MAG: hypothetical protein M3O30_05580 [Planctomycetota bacterium]|nr:hypothetical protein [Planctomycetota bacterium]
MIEIHGQIIDGLGLATRFLKKQLPLICREFPELKKCRPGTINIELETPLRIERPDYITRKINWGEQKEVFHFTRAEFELLPPGPARPGPRPVYGAWIYGPQNSPHRTNPFIIEIICERRIELRGRPPCRIRLDRAGRQTPLTIVD